jgi:hypothetical protein
MSSWSLVQDPSEWAAAVESMGLRPETHRAATGYDQLELGDNHGGGGHGG